MRYATRPRYFTNADVVIFFFSSSKYGGFDKETRSSMFIFQGFISDNSGMEFFSQDIGGNAFESKLTTTSGNIIWQPP